MADAIDEITPDQFDANWSDFGEVYDATGRRLTPLQRWNTRTGVVTRIVCTDGGSFMVDRVAGCVVTVVERHPAPLTFVPRPR